MSESSVQEQATIHPGMSNEKFVTILAVAACEVLGQAVSVVRFRPLGGSDWSWSAQARAGLHTHTIR